MALSEQKLLKNETTFSLTAQFYINQLLSGEKTRMALCKKRNRLLHQSKYEEYLEVGLALSYVGDLEKFKKLEEQGE